MLEELLPLDSSKESDFEDVKRRLHDNDLVWIQQQFGMGRLSSKFRISRFFPPNVYAHCLVAYCIGEKLELMAYEVAKLYSKEDLDNQAPTP